MRLSPRSGGNANRIRPLRDQLLSRAARIEIEVEPEFRERFQGKGEEHAIFVDPVIVTNDRITLLFKQPGLRLVLLRHCYSPVVVNPVISAESKEAAVNEKWIVIEVAVPNVELQLR